MRTHQRLETLQQRLQGGVQGRHVARVSCGRRHHRQNHRIQSELDHLPTASHRSQHSTNMILWSQHITNLIVQSQLGKNGKHSTPVTKQHKHDTQITSQHKHGTSLTPQYTHATPVTAQQSKDMPTNSQHSVHITLFSHGIIHNAASPVSGADMTTPSQHETVDSYSAQARTPGGGPNMPVILRQPRSKCLALMARSRLPRRYDAREPSESDSTSASCLRNSRATRFEQWTPSRGIVFIFTTPRLP